MKRYYILAVLIMSLVWGVKLYAPTGKIKTERETLGPTVCRLSMNSIALMNTEDFLSQQLYSSTATNEKEGLHEINRDEKWIHEEWENLMKLEEFYQKRISVIRSLKLLEKFNEDTREMMQEIEVQLSKN